VVTDHDEIQYLLAKYSFYVDYREFEKLGELLADAVFRLTWEAEGIETGEIRGREAIERFYEEHLADRRPSRHVITNVAIDLDEAGESADVFAYLTSIGHPSSPPSVLLSGHYENRFAKIGGRWRFTQLSVVMELPG
jgi:hypothetical protein